MSLLKIFKSKAPAPEKTPTAAPTAAAPDVAPSAAATPTNETKKALKSVLSAFGQETLSEGRKLESIAGQLKAIEADLNHATAAITERDVKTPLAHAIEKIGHLLPQVESLRDECFDSATQLQKMASQ